MGLYGTWRQLWWPVDTLRNPAPGVWCSHRPRAASQSRWWRRGAASLPSLLWERSNRLDLPDLGRPWRRVVCKSVERSSSNRVERSFKNLPEGSCFLIFRSVSLQVWRWNSRSRRRVDLRRKGRNHHSSPAICDCQLHRERLWRNMTVWSRLGCTWNRFFVFDSRNCQKQLEL